MLIAGASGYVGPFAVRLRSLGKITPVADRRLPWGEVVDALRWVDDADARGKVVVTT